MHPVPIKLAGAHAVHTGPPDVPGLTGQRNAYALMGSAFVEEAEFDGGRVR
jgi:hypothetical protein